MQERRATFHQCPRDCKCKKMGATFHQCASATANAKKWVQPFTSVPPRLQMQKNGCKNLCKPTSTQDTLKTSQICDLSARVICDLSSMSPQSQMQKMQFSRNRRKVKCYFLEIDGGVKIIIILLCIYLLRCKPIMCCLFCLVTAGGRRNSVWRLDCRGKQ